MGMPYPQTAQNKMSNERRNQKRRKRHVIFDEKTGMGLSYTRKKDGTIVYECSVDWPADILAYLGNHPEILHQIINRKPKPPSV